MITFDHLSKRYPNGREALTNVRFNVDRGEMVFLTGRSGAGKSTVLKLIALLERPTRGTVLVNGKNTGTLKARHIAAFRRQIGCVFGMATRAVGKQIRASIGMLQELTEEKELRT